MLILMSLTFHPLHGTNYMNEFLNEELDMKYYTNICNIIIMKRRL